MKKILAAIWIVFFVITGCETTIYPTLQPASPIYIVDAFVNNKPDTQIINLSYTQAYFDDQLPPPVSGASVVISDEAGATFTFFEHPTRKGSYFWIPAPPGFGEFGTLYNLSIDIQGEHFVSQSRIGRAPLVDSITFQPNDRVDGSGTYITAQFWAKDPPGVGDTYWIKAYKNGQLLNKPSEINLAYDAAFSKGSGFDGFEFIQPIRRGINRIETDSDDHIISPYMDGDSVYVEIHSVTEATFDFLNQVVLETNRPGGFSELFARPLSNVSTNIFNEQSGGSQVQGFFNVAAVSGNGRRYLP